VLISKSYKKNGDLRQYFSTRILEGLGNNRITAAFFGINEYKLKPFLLKNSNSFRYLQDEFLGGQFFKLLDFFS
jgi:hypothetical protein